MASSYQYLNCSKAQMCLFKILHIISSIPPAKEEACSSHGDGGSGSFRSNNKGVGIDLNLRFCSAAESGESESSAIDQGNNEAEAEVVGEKSVEVSEGRDTQVGSFKVENNGIGHVESEFGEDREGNDDFEGGKVETASFGNSNSLDMLIEAAKVLSEREESNSEEDRREVSYGLLELEKRKVKKRKERWVVMDLYGVEEAQPVVRSKRGRNRALPFRFRDSVVEPLKRTQRPSTTPHANKRRLLRSSATT